MQVQDHITFIGLGDNGSSFLVGLNLESLESKLRDIEPPQDTRIKALCFDLDTFTDYLYLSTMYRDVAGLAGKLGPDRMSPPLLNLDPVLFLDRMQLGKSIEVVYYPESRSYYLQDLEIEGETNISFSYDL